MKNHLINFVKGMVIGIANIIPGVSGGTIAVILGIFDQLIDTINHFNKNIKKNIAFILPIVLGTTFSIVTLSSVLKTCLEKYSFQTSMFFAGLVCGSIPLIYKKSVSKGFRASYILCTIISIAIVVLFSTLTNRIDEGAYNCIFSNTFFVMAEMFFGGLLSATAMVIPGISGSFVMVLLGIYPIVIGAISLLPKFILNPFSTESLFMTIEFYAPLGIGIICGVLVISKIISLMMDKFYSVTYFSILGLVIGSIYGIFSSYITYQSGVNLTSVIVGTVTLVVGFLTSYFLGEKN